MTYKVLLVDNPICSRRFHLCFDDEAEKEPNVKVLCTFCDQIIFEAQDHQPVHLMRDENLINLNVLSDHIVESCQMEDKFSESSFPDPFRQQVRRRIYEQ